MGVLSCPEMSHCLTAEIAPNDASVQGMIPGFAGARDADGKEPVPCSTFPLSFPTEKGLIAREWGARASNLWMPAIGVEIGILLYSETSCNSTFLNSRYFWPCSPRVPELE
jgi:hypothetical protein